MAEWGLWKEETDDFWFQGDGKGVKRKMAKKGKSKPKGKAWGIGSTAESKAILSQTNSIIRVKGAMRAMVKDSLKSKNWK